MKTGPLIAAILPLFLPAVALAAAPRTFADLAGLVVQFFSSATVDLIMLAIVIYFWGAASTLFKEGHERERLRPLLMWGILIIFFAVSVWGIVRLLQSTIFGQADATNGVGYSSGLNCTSLDCSFGP